MVPSVPRNAKYAKGEPSFAPTVNVHAQNCFSIISAVSLANRLTLKSA